MNEFNLDAVMKTYNQIILWIQTSSSAMDLPTLMLCATIFVLSAVAVYVISVYGMKERTYEEAMEEQKKRNKEAMQLAKQEKNRKDKRFKKWNKKNREKGDEDKSLPSEDFDEKTDQVEHKNAKSSKADFNSPESKSGNQKKKRKQKKREMAVKESLPQPSSSDETDEPISHSSSCPELKPEIAEQAFVELENRFRAMSPEQWIMFGRELPVAMCGSIEEGMHKQFHQLKNSGKRKKKNRSDQCSSNSESSELNVNKVLAFLKSGIFTDEELNYMLDALSNKQCGIGGWMKKNDPVPGLKKQLQEKEDALENERRFLHVTGEKLKSTRQELNQEKARANTTERLLREKMTHFQLEIKDLHTSIKLKHEQHASEIRSKVQQVTAKLNEENSIVLQRIKEESNKLQALNRMESEKLQRSSLEVARLQHELEQMRSSREQYDKHQAALQQAQDDMHLQTQQLEKHMEQLVTSHQEEEYSYKQRINDMSNKLQQAEKAHTSLVQELQNAQSVCSSLEADNNSLRQRLEEAKHQINVSDQDRLELQSRLEDMIDCIDRLQTEISKTKKEYMKQIQDLTNEKDSLTVQMNERMEQRANERVLGGPDDQRALVSLEEYETKIQEKNFIIQHLLNQYDDAAQKDNIQLIEDYQWTVQSLTKEIDDLKENNLELVQKYENATVALTVATEKVEAFEKMMANKESTGQKEARNLCSLEETEKQLNEVLVQMETLREHTDEKVKAVEQAADLKIAAIENNFFKEMESVKAEADVEIKKSTELGKAFATRLELTCAKVRDCLKELFPEINVDADLSDESWISELTQQAFQLKQNDSTASSAANEVKNLKIQMSEIVEEKSKMKLQIENYIMVLADTENILFKVQRSVEEEEKHWKEEFASKENNLKQVITENEKLLTENKSLEANLKQLQSFKKLQSELMELQHKLLLEEQDKRNLVIQYDKAMSEVKNLKEKLDDGEVMKALIKSDSEECATASEPTGLFGSVDPFIEDSTSNVPLKTEKRKKPRKRGTAAKK